MQIKENALLWAFHILKVCGRQSTGPLSKSVAVTLWNRGVVAIFLSRKE